MKKFITENLRFTITVIDRAKDGKPLGCRNGHEPGDAYVCEYGCPMPTNGCGGFCSKTMANLYRLKEVIYARGDLRLLGYADNGVIEFPCADGIVWFRMEVTDLAEIRPLDASYLSRYAGVIRAGFATVARDFGLTKDNCPRHTSFITDERLAEKIRDGYYPYGYFVGDTLFGFVSLTDEGGGVYSMNNLSVLPEWRHFGCGKRLLDHCKDRVVEMGGNKIVIGIIEENGVLRDWYAANGFAHTGTERFEHMPFTVGHMEWKKSGDM